MKKTLKILMGILLLAGFSACNKNNPDEPKFVDLGLPSGTLWKSQAESGYFSYDEAITKFGEMIPTQEQWQELYKTCKVKHIKETAKYTYIGPSGDSIVLSGSGRIYCDGIRDFGTHGYYWSSTSVSEDEAIRIDFDEGESFRTSNDYKCAQFSIRLVK